MQSKMRNNSIDHFVCISLCQNWDPQVCPESIYETGISTW